MKINSPNRSRAVLTLKEAAGALCTGYYETEEAIVLKLKNGQINQSTYEDYLAGLIGAIEDGAIPYTNKGQPPQESMTTELEDVWVRTKDVSEWLAYCYPDFDVPSIFRSARLATRFNLQNTAEVKISDVHVQQEKTVDHPQHSDTDISDESQQYQQLRDKIDELERTIKEKDTQINELKSKADIDTKHTELFADLIAHSEKNEKLGMAFLSGFFLELLLEPSSNGAAPFESQVSIVDAIKNNNGKAVHGASERKINEWMAQAAKAWNIVKEIREE
ncbi:TPA: hypothetical protein NKZ51_005265 [Vibrio parahaemolyticus]|nr:hypothetical protein [Vibrio parahaemolyticus]HCH5589886.1 hypothetical protein [Vibrio parahaemolyticus]